MDRLGLYDCLEMKRRKETMKKLQFLFRILLLCLIIAYILLLKTEEGTAQSSKAPEIATFIQAKVNTGGYNGCRCEVLGSDLIQCNLNFEGGTSRYEVIANTQGVADLFAQIGLAATVYYRGFSGKQKICEFKYDMYSRMVTRKE